MRKTTLTATTACFIFAALPALGAGGGGGGGGAEATQAVNADPDFGAGVAAVTSKNWQQVLAPPVPI